jgi:cubilin
LILGDHQSSATLHRYCNSESTDDKMPERFRRIRSLGRSLSLHFHTDSTVVGRGFSLQFAFLLPQEQCGFNANSPNGTIQSPNYPVDYPPNSQCIWDIQVKQHKHHIIKTSDDRMLNYREFPHI